MRYNKTYKKSRKILIYILVGIVFIACNIFTLIDAAYDANPTEKWRYTALFSSFIIECLSFFYCVVHDIVNAIKETPPKFVFKNDAKGIPFVDREELLQDIVYESEKRIMDGKHYYSKNIRYGEHNGKTTLAKKLCYEIQKIKDKEQNALKTVYPKFATKIGNIIYVSYGNYSESFVSRIKSEFTYIKGKKNIVVVDNSYEDLILWTDDLADDDVFFIFLNFNSSSDDALFFSDDKIKELLQRLKTVPAFSSIASKKEDNEIAEIAAKLGNISNNNIGTIVNLLLSNEFTLLLETDNNFVDFYFSIKHGKYEDAVQQYCKLPAPPINNKILQYKLKYESANLSHFLGDYEAAFKELELLLATICADQKFIDSALGEHFYTDIVLLQSHVKKHQGHFDVAASILENVGENHKNISWLRSHFSVNILQLNEILPPSDEWDVLLDKLYDKMIWFKEKRKIKNSDFYFYEAYFPIVCFYKNKFDKKIIPSLINTEELAIAFYEKEERRYLTNCFFIKAEFYRILGDWKNAEEFYGRCYDIYCHNGDKDILYLVAITCRFLQIFENVALNIPFDWNAAIEECKKSDGYDFHNRLISQMEIASKDNQFRRYWLPHYRVTINPIP